MRRLVLQTIRQRKAGFVGAFVALFGASVLITAFGIILQSGIGSGVPVQRYADAAVIVGGEKSFSVREGDSTKTKSLDDAVGVPSGLVSRAAKAEGVEDTVGVLRFPLRSSTTTGTSSGAPATSAPSVSTGPAPNSDRSSGTVGSPSGPARSSWRSRWPSTRT